MKVRYFTRDLLIHCAHKAQAPGWNFNRQLDPRPVAALPDLKYPVVFSMVHEHRMGVLCEPHIRAVVDLGKGKMLQVDTPAAFFNALPETEVVSKKETDAN